MIFNRVSWVCLALACMLLSGCWLTWKNGKFTGVKEDSKEDIYRQCVDQCRKDWCTGSQTCGGQAYEDCVKKCDK